MIGVQNEQNVERALERRIRAVFQFGGAEQHVQKIRADSSRSLSG